MKKAAAFFLMKFSGAILVFLAALLISVAVILVYYPVLDSEFVLDDHAFIVTNPAVKSLRNIPLFFINPASISAKKDWGTIYRPLRTVSFAIDYAIWGLQPYGFHLVNLGFHILNSILVFVLMYLLLRNKILAFFIGLFFSLHPVHSEVVSWVSSRGDVLYLFFFLLSFIMFILSTAPHSRNRNLNCGWLAGSLLTFSAGLMSKEMIITLPLVLLCWLMACQVPLSARQKIMKVAPYFLVLGVYLVLKFWLLENKSAYGFPAGSYWLTILSMTATFSRYLKLLVWPHPLCISYFWLPVSTNVSDGLVVTGLALFAILVSSMIWAFRHNNPFVIFFLCWFLITLVPVSNLLVPINVLMAERFLYLPSIGFIAAVLLPCVTWFQRTRSRAILGIIIGLIVASIMGLTLFSRSVSWQNPRILFEKTIETAPRSSMARIELARLALQELDPELAEHYLAPLLDWYPRYLTPILLMLEVRMQQGRLDEVNVLLQKARNLDPESETMWYHQGLVQRGQGQSDQARTSFQNALDVFPDYTLAWNALGNLAMETENNDLAQHCFKRALILDPDNGSILLNRANLALRTNDTSMARKYLDVARQKAGETPMYLFLSGVLAEKQANPQQALLFWQHSLARGLHDPLVYFNLGTLCLNLGKFRLSALYFEELARAFPAYSRAYNNHALALYHCGRVPEALILLERTLLLAPENNGLMVNFQLMKQTLGEW